ncbi:MAG: flagellar hook-basal body complex protein FliE [Bryobacteraceae bacterium]|jgi:flagellar hook-basal body complex protein FliE
MPSPISAITPLPPLDPTRPLQPAGAPGQFQSVLEGTIKNLQSIQDDSTEAVQKFLTGENEELHTTVLAAEKAELAFDLGLQVRNKVVSAYQEIMRMQM